MRRLMLKGRDLHTEKYYSGENIEALRGIYRTKIHPRLWTDTSTGPESEKMKKLQEKIDRLEKKVHLLEDAWPQSRRGCRDQMNIFRRHRYRPRSTLPFSERRDRQV
jgi:hypothetical protein